MSRVVGDRCRRVHRGTPGRAACVTTGSNTSGPWTRSRWTSGISASTMSTTARADLQEKDSCRMAAEGMDIVYNLAADMGGMGFIENNKALCMLSVLISTHMLEAARHAGVQRLFYSSSACVYAAGKQESPEVEPLARPTPTRPCPRTATAGRSCSASAWPATSTRTSASRPGSPATTTSTARSAPTTAAVRRRRRPSAARWPERSSTGTNRDRDLGRRQTDPELHLHRRLRRGDAASHRERRRRAAQHRLGRSWSRSTSSSTSSRASPASPSSATTTLTAPQGVRGRNSDNTLIKERLGWAPSITLEDGLQNTYKWIFDQMSSGVPPIVR